MIITLPTSFGPQVEAFGIDVPESDEVLDSQAFNVDLRTLEESQIDKLYEMLKPHSDARSIRVAINAFRRDDSAQGEMKATKFEQLASDLQAFLTKDATRGWIYKHSDYPEPELVVGVSFSPYVKRSRDRGEINERITIRTQVNHLGKTVNRHHTIEGEGGNRTLDPVALLQELGLRKETDELHKLYDEQLERFREIRPMYGEQLILVRDHNTEIDDPDEDKHYYYRKKKTVNLKEGVAKLVHDQPMAVGGFTLSRWNQADPNKPAIWSDLRAHIFKNLPKDTKAFTRCPHDMTFRVYHLDRHVNTNVHVMEVEIYQYDEQIRKGLVLPGMYNEVLDVLTSEMQLVQADVVDGKSGGNVILLAGPPGLGKTLTAEVYAEYRKVALLKVHSGQLGTTAKQVEEKLLHFFKLATNWGIPILLDEFDVFGRERADNLEQNAIVAVFLRTLEYQANTLFLTTNRHRTMDDAILSRCMAIIAYELPKEQELRQIWKTLRDAILPGQVEDQLLDEMMDYFVEQKKQMSGRDVKNILRLAERYARTGKKITKDLLITCAGFRGV